MTVKLHKIEGRFGIVSAFRRGMTVDVASFNASSFSHPGGQLRLLPSGTWYVGVDLFSREVIALPRLGHRGWIPLAKVVTGPYSISSIEDFIPVLPMSRLPRTMKKLRTGQNINVLVLGSSLAEGGSGTTDWSGMLFNAASSVSNYRLPVSMTFNNFALGGTPNQYQLAQLGLGSSHTASDYTAATFPSLIGPKTTPPNGRSSMLSGVDLVVLTTLANGGDYRMECIEPIVRTLRKQGIEVILTTDNPQGMPFANYQAITTAALYTDGPEVMRIAELYGVELADTAAFVVDAYLRYPSASIYRDSIHMFAATPAGRTGQPSGGYEVYARAIRSLFTIDAALSGASSNTYDFVSDVQGFRNYSSGIASWDAAGKLKVTKNGAASNQWGAGSPLLPPIKAGDTVTVTFTLSNFGGGYTYGPTVGLQGGGSGWGSNTVGQYGASGTYTATLTAIRDITDGSGYVLFFGNTNTDPDGVYFEVDDVTITVNSTYQSPPTEPFFRQHEFKPLPPARQLTDFKTPGDAFVVLPLDEWHYRSGSNAGTLGAHPAGAASFARRFNSAIGATQDLLTLTTGQRAALMVNGGVGFSIIYYAVNGDPGCTFDVYRNNIFQKTVTIAAQTLNRETYLSIYDPTTFNKTNGAIDGDGIDIRVTSGTLRIAALVALTFDMDYYPPEHAKFIGAWSSKISGGAPSMLGYKTDTSGDYALAYCPPEAKRLYWIVSSKVNSQPVTTYAGRSSTIGQNNVGANHIKCLGGHVGPGAWHYAQCAGSIAGDGTNGYALHIGGIITVNDR